MNPNEIDAELEELFGVVDWSEAKGVLQVAALEASSDRVLIPGPEAPPSATDRFLLGFARARADAVVTSGAILRAEPDLIHDYAETASGQAGFATWRRDRLGRAETPLLLVLSASGRFPVDHPALARARRVVVWTTAAGRERLLPFLAEADARGVFREASAVEIRVGSGEGVGVRAAIDWLQRERAAAVISIEAGPSVAQEVYTDAFPRCDELLLSRFQAQGQGGKTWPLGPSFVSRDRIEALLSRVSCAERLETSGIWRFERYCAEDVRPGEA